MGLFNFFSKKNKVDKTTCKEEKNGNINFSEIKKEEKDFWWIEKGEKPIIIDDLEEFYSLSMNEFGKMLITHGHLTSVSSAYKGLDSVGKKVACEYLYDRYLKNLRSRDLYIFYEAVLSYCFEAGLTIGYQWFTNKNEFEKFVDKVIRETSYDYIGTIYAKYLSLNNDCQKADLKSKMWRIFFDLLKGHSKKEDFEQYKLTALLAAFNLGVLIIEQKLKDVIVEEKENISDIQVTDELLIGRNFYHYTNGECDEEQPFVLETDLSYLEASDDGDDEDDDDYDEDEYDEEYGEYLPLDCWIKKISAFKDDKEIYYHIILEVNDGVATSISVVKDKVYRLGGGMFFVPGMAMPADHDYEEVDVYDYPEEVYNELKALKKKRYLPNKFSFMGKKLPQKILDRGGNGGDMTDHTYAIQSAYRLAYTHMSVLTTENGIIKDFDYSSYQSTGSGYGDMFAHSNDIGDKHEEIVDMLLYIIDLYSDEEFDSLK